MISKHFWANLTLVMIWGFNLLCVYETLGVEPDPHSFTDYLKSTGRKSTYEDRKKLYEYMYNRPYDGSAPQNIETLKALRFGDVLSRDVGTPDEAVFPSTRRVWMNEATRRGEGEPERSEPDRSESLGRLVELFGDQPLVESLHYQKAKALCVPVYDRPAFLSPNWFIDEAISARGYPAATSVVGGARRGEHLPEACFWPGTTEHAGWLHDKGIYESGPNVRFYHIGNERLRNVNYRMSNDTPDRVIAAPFVVLDWLAPSRRSSSFEIDPGEILDGVLPQTDWSDPLWSRQIRWIDD